uniref:Zinc knuckle CX2CX4HX4C n=1 Tax=Tanacetum cinerariifolium TaxID=118510 RepID=A0A699KUH4_TANCI|nr:hypothetical protein [Tanacetum cinerariifolium]
MYNCGLGRIALDDDDDDDVLGVLTLDSRVDVVVPVESIRATSERFANTACGFFLVKLHGVPVMTFRDGGLRAIAMKIVEVVVMPKLTREGFYTCTVRVEYDLETLRDVCCKVFGHIQKECPKNPGLGVAKNLKKSSQALRGVSVGPKVIFKPSK